MKPSDRIGAQPSEWPEADGKLLSVAGRSGRRMLNVYDVSQALPTGEHLIYTRATVERLLTEREAALRTEIESLRAQLAGRAGLDAQGLRFAEFAAENGLTEFMKYEAESVYLWLLDAHRAQRKEE